MPAEEHCLFRDHFMDIFCVDTRRLGTGKWKQYSPHSLLKSSHYGGDRYKQSQVFQTEGGKCGNGVMLKYCVCTWDT